MSAALRVSVLTRDAHRGGAWMTSLVRALQERLSTVEGAVVQVCSIEHADIDRALLPSRGAPQCDLLVNRVSDAAPPATAKKAATILRACELHGIPVINGALCFGVGNNKMLHHQVLSAGAGLRGRGQPRACAGTPSPRGNKQDAHAPGALQGRLRRAAQRRGVQPRR